MSSNSSGSQHSQSVENEVGVIGDLSKLSLLGAAGALTACGGGGAAAQAALSSAAVSSASASSLLASAVIPSSGSSFSSAQFSSGTSSSIYSRNARSSSVKPISSFAGSSSYSSAQVLPDPTQSNLSSISSSKNSSPSSSSQSTSRSSSSSSSRISSSRASSSQTTGNSSTSKSSSNSSSSNQSSSQSASSEASASISSVDASRFLHQATMGPTYGLIEEVVRKGYEAWIEAQFQITRPISYLDRLRVNIPNQDIGKSGVVRFHHIPELFIQQAVAAEDQLRCRVAFALSEIFVVSLGLFKLEVSSSSVMAFNDMLHELAFGNYRDILYRASRSTTMGIYLTFIGNSNTLLISNPNFVPDENYARELLQLFSIGVEMLNLDGTPVLDANGLPIPTYTNDDIKQLARVFTGWAIGWDANDPLAAHWDLTLDAAWNPGQHLFGPKTFLGATINETEMLAELNAAIDVIFNHQNVGPFISTQLIQRLVTSNPSPAYIARVARQFNDNGVGVRGDMKAVICAILLDDEARNVSRSGDENYGKLREPILMLTNFMRISNMETSVAGVAWDFPPTGEELKQTPYFSPSVFNFFRPGFSPAGTELGRRGLKAPEFQVVDEVSVITILNFIYARIRKSSLKFSNLNASYKDLILLAQSPEVLVERVDLLLSSHRHSIDDRKKIIEALVLVVPSDQSATAFLAANVKRIQMCIFMIMSSPKYLIQK